MMDAFEWMGNGGLELELIENIFKKNVLLIICWRMKERHFISLIISV
jgi:hypothetical protein